MCCMCVCVEGGVMCVSLCPDEDHCCSELDY